jgi:hypothetical protein
LTAADGGFQKGGNNAALSFMQRFFQMVAGFALPPPSVSR